MSNGRDFYTTISYLDYVPSYKDIQTNLELYIDYYPETLYHFSCGIVCFCLKKTSYGWFVRSRGCFNPKGTFQTIYKSKDFLEAYKMFQEYVFNFLSNSLKEISIEVPF